MDLLETLHDSPTVHVTRARLPNGIAVVCKSRPQRKSKKRSAHARLRYEMRMLELLAPARCEHLPQPIAIEGDDETLTLLTADIGGVRVGAVPDLKMADILTVGIHVARALQVVHQRHLVHKDVNPNNIVYNRRSGLAQLIDFELASPLARETQDSEMLLDFEGTPAFLAPEQTGCTNMAVDHRTDLYALGVTLYTLLAGKPPFVRDDISDLVYAILSTPADPVETAAPRTPGMFAAIITKLIRKNPDERYQSAQGLLHDLQRCQDGWLARERIDTFPLATKDFSGTLELPQRLFGRDEARRKLVSAFDACVASGSLAVAMIHGPSGIGKSSLLRAVQPDILRHRGWFAAGVHEAMRQHIPFDAIGGAIAMVVRRILAEPEVRQARWRRRLQETVGNPGQALVDIVPSLEHLIGPQKPVAELGPRETENRLLMLLQDVITTLCRHQPLVLFLDDLHWADSGTLRLLEMLARQPAMGAGLLLVGSFRATEVGPEHPLQLWLERMNSHALPVTNIELSGLTLAQVQQFLKLCTRAEDADIFPLAERLLVQTDGNPFFLHELVKHLWLQDFIRYRPQTHTFGWNLLNLAHVSPPGGVAALMSQKLSSLPTQDFQLLCRAACFGSVFELGFLCELCACSRSEAAERLQSSLRLGVIVPLTPGYRYAADISSEVRYQFGHDRIRQAAYDMVPAEAKLQWHGRIGMLLHQRMQTRSDVTIFDVLEHLNRAKDTLESAQSKQQLADMNLLAAGEARRSASPRVALEHLRLARELAADDIAKARPGWLRQLAMETVTNEFLDNRHQEALSRLDALSATAKNTQERMEATSLRIMVLAAEGRHREALQACIAGLQQLGFHVNLLNPWAVPWRLAQAWRVVWSQPRNRLENLPPCDDEKVVWAHRLLSESAYSCQSLSPITFINAACFGMVLLMQRGRTPFHGYGLTALAALARALGLHQACRKLDAAAQVVIDRGDFWGPVPVAMTRYWIHALADGGPEDSQKVDALYAMARKAGESTYTGLTAGGVTSTRLYHDLDAFEAKAVAFRGFLSERKDRWLLMQLDAEIEAARRLVGPTAELPAAPITSATAAREDFEPGFPRKLAALARMLAHVVFDETPQAYAELMEILGIEAWFQLPPVPVVDMCILGTLVLADMLRLKLASQTALHPRMRLMRNHLKRLAEAREGESYEGVYLLAQAEWAAARGRNETAAALFCKMAHHLEYSTWTVRRAVGFERAARFFLRQSNSGMGLFYLRRSLAHYQAWGADAKVELMAREVRGLEQSFAFGQAPQAASTARGAQTSASESASRSQEHTMNTANGAVGFKALVRAAQAVSKEVVTERVVEKIIEALQRGTGATRVALLFVNNQDLELAIDTAPKAELPMRFLTFVMRSKEAVVVDDIKKPAHPDAYFERTSAKSALCAPILQRTSTTAVVYLENNQLPNAFSRARVDVVELLAAQASIALENAKAYGNLETQVNRRTEELREAHTKLMKLQVEGTEAMMAGGFAHEMRNALSSARMLLANLIPIEAAQAGETLADSMVHDLTGLQRAAAQLNGSPDARAELVTAIRQVRERQAALVEMLTGVAQGVERGLSITRETLAYAEVGSLVAGDHTVGVQQLIADVLRAAGANIEKNSIQVEVRAEPGVVLAIKEEHAYTIVRNLVANAVDALARQTKGARQMRLQVDATAQSVVLAVEDNGIGMTAKTRQRVFQPFFTTKGRDGTGLGLGLSRKLASVYGGSLTFTSNEGVGTVFILTLPVRSTP